MPRASKDYRAAVQAALQDGAWHSALELVRVGGLRFAARIHELRHDGGHRVLNRVVDGCSEYRWTCECGPLPADPGPEVRFCAACRAALVEVAGAPVPPPAPEPVATPHQAPAQLGLFQKGRAA